MFRNPPMLVRRRNTHEERSRNRGAGLQTSRIVGNLNWCNTGKVQKTGWCYPSWRLIRKELFQLPSIIQLMHYYTTPSIPMFFQRLGTANAVCACSPASHQPWLDSKGKNEEQHGTTLWYRTIPHSSTQSYACSWDFISLQP